MQVEIKVAVVAMALFAGSAQAHAAPPPDSVPIQLPLDTDVSTGGEGPDLLATPSNDDLEREYPPVARLMDLGGRSTLTCTAMTDGRLAGCRAVQESPAGLGFGAAALRVAVYFRAKPAMKDGRPVEGTITIPMRWQMEEDQVQPVAEQPAYVSPAALALGLRVVALESVSDNYRVGWQPMVDKQMAELAAESDPQAAKVVADAFRQGLNDAIQEQIERQAHELGAHMSEADLRSTISFLETPAAKAWLDANEQISVDLRKTFFARIAELARNHYCPQTGDCPGFRAASASR